MSHNKMSASVALTIFAISVDTTTDELKARYRELALENHPDKVKTGSKAAANAKMAQINNAYEVLQKKVSDNPPRPKPEQPESKQPQPKSTKYSARNPSWEDYEAGREWPKLPTGPYPKTSKYYDRQGPPYPKPEPERCQCEWCRKSRSKPEFENSRDEKWSYSGTSKSSNPKQVNGTKPKSKAEPQDGWFSFRASYSPPKSSKAETPKPTSNTRPDTPRPSPASSSPHSSQESDQANAPRPTPDPFEGAHPVDKLQSAHFRLRAALTNTIAMSTIRNRRLNTSVDIEDCIKLLDHFAEVLRHEIRKVEGMLAEWTKDLFNKEGPWKMFYANPTWLEKVVLQRLKDLIGMVGTIYGAWMDVKAAAEEEGDMSAWWRWLALEREKFENRLAGWEWEDELCS